MFGKNAESWELSLSTIFQPLDRACHCMYVAEPTSVRKPSEVASKKFSFAQ